MEIQQRHSRLQRLPSIGEAHHGEPDADKHVMLNSLPSDLVHTDAPNNPTVDQPNLSGPASAIAPWKDSSRFLGREAELEQLKALKDKIIGEHQSNATPPAPESSADEAKDKTKATTPPAPKPKPRKRLDVHPAALVWGVSGTGKSALVDHFLDTCCICNTGVDQKQQQQQQQQNNDQAASSSSSCSCCYVLRGKYDEYTGQSDPFSAIVQALQDFTTQLKNGPKEELDRMRECVRKAFPTGGLRPMVKVVPSLSILMPKSARGDTSVISQSVSRRDDYSMSMSMHGSQMNGDLSAPSSGGAVTDNAWNQLQYIFVQFIKAVSTKERPIYMFLDDLQWSASIGLDLIAQMVADPGLRNFMLLGAIRQDVNPHTDEPMDFSPDHPLSRCLVAPLSPDAAIDNDQNAAAGPDDASVMTASTSMSKVGKRRHPRNLRQITITNLTPDDMTAWLSSMLDCNDIEDLSEKLYAKTEGNIFFTMQALEELERKDILTFNLLSQQWEWSLSNPEDDDNSNAGSAQLPISDDILGIIESKLRDLPMQLQQVLSVAAYIRSMFEISVLHRVLENECKHVDGEIDDMDRISTAQELSDMLETAVLERLISNPIGGTKYHFAHDRIQQAAQGMIPAGEARDKLRVRIGHCLLKVYRRMQVRLQNEHEEDYEEPHGINHRHKKASGTEAEDKSNMSSESTHSTTSAETFTSTFTTSEVDDGLLFVAADHLNSVPTKDHIFSATMNMEVGEKALEMAALESAVGYLQKAHASLQLVRSSAPATISTKTKGSARSQAAASPSIWDGDEHYGLCLRVYCARADVELSLGSYEVGYKLCDEVLERARSLEDKMATYLSMARALARQDRHAETLAVELRLLRSLKTIPKRWYALHIIKCMMKIKSFLKNNTNEEILSMPLMTDPKKLFAMKVAADFAICTKATGNMLLVILNLCKMMSTTIKYGICKESANAFITYGLVIAGMGEQATAERCTEISHDILDLVDGKTTQGNVRFITSWYIIPFSRPFPDLLRQFRRGYLDSLEVGEFDMGLLNYQGAVFAGMLSGLEVGPLLKAAEAVLDQMAAYKITAFGGIAVHLRVMFANFREEEPVDWPELEASSKRDVTTETLDQSELISASMLFYTRAVLTLFHRQYELAERLIRNFVLLNIGEISFQYIVGECFITGLISAARFRETGKRSYLTTLRKLTKKLRDIAKARGQFWMHHVLMMEAEELAITLKNKQSPRIQHAYNLAIIAATKAGCIHDAALTNEMAGEHFVEHGSKEMVGDYFVHAVDYYTAWGGKSKVTDIKKRRKKYLKTLNDPNRQRPEGLTADGNGNYLFGITRDTFTGAITSRCTELNVFTDRSKGGDGHGNALVLGSELGDGLDGSVGLDDDDLSVLTDID